jgi:hypothetical protein
LSYVFRPTSNTRLVAVSEECGASDTVVATVHGSLSISAHRNGIRNYTFSGRYLPGSVNEGRSVRLVYRKGAGAVQRASGVVHDGVVTIRVAFTGSAKLTFFLESGQNLVNASARSADRPTLIF